MEKQFPKNVRQIGNVCDTPKIYVEDYVDTYLNQIKENTQGSTRARTSVSKLKRIEIALPPKKEQISIAKILSDMDNEIDLLNKKLEKYRNLKTAMMQQLLTGKIRLVK